MLVPCKACGSSCAAISKGCSACLCPPDRPSPIFVIFSSIVNVAVAIIAAVGITKDVPDDEVQKKLFEESNVDLDVDRANTYFGVMFGIVVVNLIFAAYLYWRFTTMTTGARGMTDRAGAAWKLFMYDIGVFLYMLFAIFIVVWLFLDHKCVSIVHMGTVTYKIEGADSKNECITYCNIGMWIYLVLGLVVVFMSVCTECCRTPRYITYHQQQQQGVPLVSYQQQYQPQPPPPQAMHYNQNGGHPPPPHPAPHQPPPQQYQPQQPQQQKGMAEKAGTAIGGIIGKGIGALKK